MPELPGAVLLADIDAVLAAYGLTRSGMPVRTEGGTLNANYRTPTAAGPVCRPIPIARNWEGGNNPAA